MSDHDTPDPIDKAYDQAEAMLSDDAARAARRARVLAAVAHEPAMAAASVAAAPVAAHPISAPQVRRSVWRRNGWLAAACVAVLCVVLAVQYRPPVVRPHPAARPSAPAAAAALPATAVMPPSAAVSETPHRTPPQPPQLKKAPRSEPARAETAPPKPKAFPAAPPESVQEVVVTGSRIPHPGLTSASPLTTADASSAKAADDRAYAPVAAPAPPPPPPLLAAQAEPMFGARDIAPAESLAAAAAAGRTAEVERLLAHGAAVDATDAKGDTALMRSIRADKPAVASVLLRHGASLDRKNKAGESARDMAKAVDDAKLDKALGIER